MAQAKTGMAAGFDRKHSQKGEQLMNSPKQVSRFRVMGAAVLLLLLLLAGCNQDEAALPAESNGDEAEAQATVTPEDSSSPAGAEASGPVTIETEGEVPFYARFGENETFGDGERVAIVFYRPPECVPPDFNLNQFFHFPSEENPGAFACAPPTTTAVETWANDPETDPAPLASVMTGRGAVPVWFFAAGDISSAMADGVVTIGELAELPSQEVGTAATYNELLHPSQSNEQSLVQIEASGAMEDGRDFSLDISYGAPDVEDHVTIDMAE